jgi:hypothetical protein
MKNKAALVVLLSCAFTLPLLVATVSPSVAAAEAAPVALELNKPITEDKFQKVARRAYARRNWTVTEVQGNVVRGTFERKGITYKAEIELKTGVIVFRFVPGFADARPNYLNNLRVDVQFELTND